MRGVLHVFWRFISGNAVLSAAGNVLTLGPLLLGAAVFAAGLVSNVSGLVLAGVALFVLNLVWLASLAWRHRNAKPEKPNLLGPKERREHLDNLLYPPADEKQELGEQCATFAMKVRVFNEEQEWKREKAIAHLAEELREAEPEIEPRKARKEAEAHFQRNVEATYAVQMRTEALRLFDQAREQGAIALKARRVAASPLAVEMGEVPNLFVAIARRLGHEPGTGYSLNTINSAPEDLKGQLDSLMREGMQLVDEFTEPVKPQKTESGGWKLEGGGAPEEWWEKADDFTKRTRKLLTDRHPALLTDYRDGYNAHVKKERSDDQEPEPAEDTRSTAEKMLDFANYERSGPSRVIEASLEGLAAARHRLGPDQG